MKESYRIIFLSDGQGIIGKKMANDESVLDKYSHWHKYLQARFEVLATINFTLKGLPKLDIL